MFTRKLLFVAAVAGSSLSLAAQGPQPANQGKDYFDQQCALCHSAAPGDNGGAQGPLLHELFGREAASTGFSYSRALKNSGLTWDEATLDRFLAAPVEVVPGSMMVVGIDNDRDRANVIAYFKALKEGTFQAPPPPPGFAGFGAPPAAEPPKGDPDWKKDKPGRVHKVDLNALPEPFETSSAMNFPSVIDRPAGAELQVPAGFKVETFTTALTAPRDMVIAPNGDIFIAETTSNRISVMRPNADHSAPQSVTVYAQGIVQPLGMAFYPAENPEWLYVAEMNRVIRYPYSEGDTVASAIPEVIVPQLAPTGGGHYTRGLAFSRDGSKMFVSVGSMTNVADAPNDLQPPKSAAEIAAWERQKGIVGAAWGNEENRAAVLVFDHGNEAASGHLYATGIRNCVGLTVQPQTGDLWCSTNERDMLGDNLVPDYSTRVPEGSFFGWPWYYMGDNEDPRHAGQRPDLVGKISIPDVPYTSHSAAVDLNFYPADQQGASKFPAEYANQGFAVLHGSWNRAHRTGHKIVQVPIVNGQPTGEYIDFLTGFIDPDGNAWGRPVALAIASDGSMLLADDGANIVYRISYGK